MTKHKDTITFGDVWFWFIEVLRLGMRNGEKMFDFSMWKKIVSAHKLWKEGANNKNTHT